MQEVCPVIQAYKQLTNGQSVQPMYWTYIKERLGLEVLEKPEGFALFKVIDDGVYLQEMYVKPECRWSGIGKQFVEEIGNEARAQGFKKLYTSCVPSGLTSDSALRAILACGFKLVSCEKDIIYLVKEL